MTRREILAAAAAAGTTAAAQPPAVEQAIVARHDGTVERYLKQQITDPAHRYRGSFPDAHGLFHAMTAGGLIDTFTSAFLLPQSRFHKRPELLERILLAAECLGRQQNAEGNVDLVITNFNSPPDTGFVVHNVAAAAHNARRYGVPEIEVAVAPFLKKAGPALARGGVHTPNHRWVVCAALAQIHALFPDSAYVRRIGQWLAEGIDIDSDGQYSERSTLVYNVVTNRALIVMAAKMNRPELLEPVRRNLDSMLYLLHPGYEVVT